MRLTYGVGINDANYKTQDIPSRWFCPLFITWRNMLKRVYHSGEIARRPSYMGSSVCSEWFKFTNFKSWMESQDWKGKQLDKDLLIPGNKHYSPERCCFVSQAVNTFLVDRLRCRGDHPVGVYYRKDKGRFVAQISDSGKKRFLGFYDSPGAAHAAWLDRKISLAKEHARMEDDPKISRAIIEMYTLGGYLK